MLRNSAQGLGITEPMEQNNKSKNVIQWGGGIYFLPK